MEQIEVKLTNSPTKNPHIIIYKKDRNLFPGYRVPFVLETSRGEVTTYITSGTRDSKKGSQDGKYIARGMTEVFRGRSDIHAGNRLVIEIVEPKKRYRLLDAAGASTAVEPASDAVEGSQDEGYLRPEEGDTSDERYLWPEEGDTADNDGDDKPLVMRQIRARRGQQAFRDALIDRYGHACLISGCRLMDVVEAAHIKPVQDGGGNDPDNGLLLRADLHTLFDLDFIGIEPGSLTVWVDPKATEAGYGVLHGRRLDCAGALPNPKALAFRWELFRRRWIERYGE